jgi:hypothetical protein
MGLANRIGHDTGFYGGVFGGMDCDVLMIHRILFILVPRDEDWDWDGMRDLLRRAVLFMVFCAAKCR